MAIYRYVKQPPKQPKKKRWVLSALLTLSGFLMVSWVSWPIISFRFVASPKLAQTVAPIPTEAAVPEAEPPKHTQLASDIKQNEEGRSDYSDPNTWFPGKPQKRVVTEINSYTLSVPALEIESATVRIAGDSLEKSLIHYGGTGLPGTYGNTVIFGHSTLPQFFDPKSYTTIFSLLPSLRSKDDLKQGDEIFLTYDGATYRYEIEHMYITKPNDLSPLEQRYDDSYVTLITCVPPGTYWERLNVVARLQSI